MPLRNKARLHGPARKLQQIVTIGVAVVHGTGTNSALVTRPLASAAATHLGQSVRNPRSAMPAVCVVNLHFPAITVVASNAVDMIKGRQNHWKSSVVTETNLHVGRLGQHVIGCALHRQNR